MLETFSFSLLSFLAAVRVAEQAKKESDEKENVSSMAERSSGALSFRLAEQLRNFARDLEMRPAEIMQELAGWQKEQEAQVVKAASEASSAQSEQQLFQEKAALASKQLEDELPSLERKLQEAQENLEQASNNVFETTLREQEAKVALEEAEAHVPKAEKALSEAEHLRDELLEEAKHLDVVVEMLHNSLKALNQLRHHNGGKALVVPQGFPGQ